MLLPRSTNSSVLAASLGSSSRRESASRAVLLEPFWTPKITLRAKVCDVYSYKSGHMNSLFDCSLRLDLRNVCWIIHILLNLRQQSVSIWWQMRRVMPIEHFQRIRRMSLMSPRLCYLFRRVRIQSVLKLPFGPASPHEWALSPHMQQESVLRQDVIVVSVL